MHQYNDLDYMHKFKGRLITAIKNNTNNKIIKRIKITRKDRKKNNCMDISSDKKKKSHNRKLGCDKESETLKEKLNLF